MTHTRRARFVALTQLLLHHYPDLDDPAAAIRRGLVLVDGSMVTNPKARVRVDAGIRLVRPRRLRGRDKLAAGLDAFALDVTGLVAVDIGAAAGGFTAALLDRGAARVYAVDAGFGQLAGWLRQDHRVVDLERTNVATIDTRMIPDIVDLVTVDVSYLAAPEAIRSAEQLRLAPAAVVVALIKPTFELRAALVVTDPSLVRTAVRGAAQAIDSMGWRVLACTIPAVTGAGGAIEAFVMARRLHDH